MLMRPDPFTGLAKQKWFVMTPTHLAYMDWEGAHVKNAWPLKGATVKRVDQVTFYRCYFERPELVRAVQAW